MNVVEYYCTNTFLLCVSSAKCSLDCEYVLHQCISTNYGAANVWMCAWETLSASRQVSRIHSIIFSIIIRTSTLIQFIFMLQVVVFWRAYSMRKCFFVSSHDKSISSARNIWHTYRTKVMNVKWNANLLNNKYTHFRIWNERPY